MFGGFYERWWLFTFGWHSMQYTCTSMFIQFTISFNILILKHATFVKSFIDWKLWMNGLYLPSLTYTIFFYFDDLLKHGFFSVKVQQLLLFCYVTKTFERLIINEWNYSLHTYHTYDDNNSNAVSQKLNINIQLKLIWIFIEMWLDLILNVYPCINFVQFTYSCYHHFEDS